jgi:hypothetical protein
MDRRSDVRPRVPQAAVIKWLVIGWLIAGTCDITYATGFSYLRSGVAPSRILQSVASGVLGRAAFEGGTRTATLGLGLHYLNALIITTIFFLVARARPDLVRRPVLTGVVYGIVVYLVMNYVVIPLSAIGAIGYPPPAIWITGVLVHMFLIGVPIALTARRAFLPSTGDQERKS